MGEKKKSKGGTLKGSGESHREFRESVKEPKGVIRTDANLSEALVRLSVVTTGGSQQV